jgi:lipopolysaccharide/colanic/teichoic acid biosynthesis glycosyltransferase
VQALDWVLTAALAECAALWGVGASVLSLPLAQAVTFLGVSASLKIGLWLTESYPACVKERAYGFGGLALGAILGVVAAVALAPDAQSAGALAALLPMTALVMAGVHVAARTWTEAGRSAGMFGETVILIGATKAAQRFCEHAGRSGDVRVLAVIDDRLLRTPPFVGATPAPGNVTQLLQWDGLPFVDRIVVALPQKAEARVRETLEKLSSLPQRVDLLLDYQAHAVQGRDLDTIGDAPLIQLAGKRAGAFGAALKRGLDLAVGALLLTLAAAPMLAIALAVRLESRGPALTRQLCLGLNNRPIAVRRFRCARGETATPTRLGALLRASGLDGLPMLLGVLKGEMSLVGPRPHAAGLRVARRCPERIVADYAHRHRVKPGLTGPAQIDGDQGAPRNAAELRRSIERDLAYAARASLWLDLQILARSLYRRRRR